MKQVVRLNESELHQLISECVNETLSEFGHNNKYGEKWYNPSTWMSKDKKDEFDRKERLAAYSKQQAQQNVEAQKQEDERRKQERLNNAPKWVRDICNGCYGYLVDDGVSINDVYRAEMQGLIPRDSASEASEVIRKELEKRQAHFERYGYNARPTW